MNGPKTKVIDMKHTQTSNIRMNRHGTPDRRYGAKGPQQDRWLITDPELRQLRYRFLRARCQARYWGQEWTLTWKQFAEVCKPYMDKMGRNVNDMNITRKDLAKGWIKKNVQMMKRIDACKRTLLKDKNGRMVKRVRNR